MMSSVPIRAGFGKVNITPKADAAATFNILDPLCIRALHLRQGQRQVTFLRYDPVDPQVGVVRCNRDRRPQLALVNFGCHALSLWARRGNISGDYPGRLTALLAQAEQARLAQPPASESLATPQADTEGGDASQFAALEAQAEAVIRQGAMDALREATALERRCWA